MALSNSRYIGVGSLVLSNNSSVSVLHIASQIDYVVGRANRSPLTARHVTSKHVMKERSVSKTLGVSLRSVRRPQWKEQGEKIVYIYIYIYSICTTRYMNKVSKLTSMSQDVGRGIGEVTPPRKVVHSLSGHLPPFFRLLDVATI